MKGLAVQIRIDLVRREISDAYEKDPCLRQCFKFSAGNIKFITD